MFRIPDLRNKVLFTLFIIALYRLGANITVPGIDFNQVQKLQQQAKAGGVLSFLNLFSGGALTQMAVFALGIMPYITSSIIMQLLAVVIFTNVVSRMPAQLGNVRAQAGWFTFVLVMALGIGMIVAIVFVEQGQRRIPVQFAKRVVGRRMYGGQSTYIPLKVNQAGVIPIIFASSVLYLPVIAGNILPADGWGAAVQRFINDHVIKQDDIGHLVLY